MLQILSVIFAAIGVIGFFFYFSHAIGAGIIVLITMLAIAGILYALGEISSDIRDINNILRIVYADKLEENDSEPFDGEKFLTEIEEELNIE